MADRSFQYDPIGGQAALSSFALTDPDRSPTTVLAGSKLQMGLMALLLNAELMAGEAGLVPMVHLDDGSKGVIAIGAAREVIHTAPDGVRTMYLAAHGIARRAHNEARDVTARGGMGEVNLLLSPALGMGALPLIAVVVLGVAAIVAAAYYAKSATEKIVETRSTELKYAAKLDALQRLAMPIVASGMDLPPEFWAEYGNFSESEQTRDTMRPYLYGAGALAAAGLAYWAWTKKSEGARAR